MPKQTQLGARLVVSFELADVKKQEGLYKPELTVEELLTAIEEYTLSGCQRTKDYNEDISNAFLCPVDFAVAEAAKKAVLAIFDQMETEKVELAAKNIEIECRLEKFKEGNPPHANF